MIVTFVGDRVVDHAESHTRCAVALERDRVAAETVVLRGLGTSEGLVLQRDLLSRTASGRLGYEKQDPKVNALSDPYGAVLELNRTLLLFHRGNDYPQSIRQCVPVGSRRVGRRPK